MTDAIKIIAEARGAELLAILRAALDDRPYWRREARQLVTEIEALKLPEPVREAFRAIDAKKREAEIMRDLHRPVHTEEAPDGM